MSEIRNKQPGIRFKGFSGEWQKKYLGDIIEGLYNGQTPSRFKDEFWKGDINWLTSGELNRSIVTSTIEKITFAGQSDANLRIVPKNTFVMAITGLEAAGTRGNCGILDINTTLNQSCMAIFVDPKRLTTYFLFQWYNTVSDIYGLRYTQGTKQQSYNAEIIKKLDISLPNVKEQTKIGDFFQNLDQAISLNQSKYDKLLNIKKACLEKMFPKEGATTPEVRFKGFSEEWEEHSLGEVAAYTKGFAFKSNEYKDYGTRIIRVSDLSEDSVSEKVEKIYTDINIKNANFYSAYIIKYADIIITTVGSKAELRESAVGRPIFINKNKSYLLNQNLVKLSPYNNYYSQFLYGQLLRSCYSQYISNIQRGNANQANITIYDLWLYTFKVPTLNEQTQIGNFFKHLDQLISLRKTQLDKLKNIKKACLDKMFV